MALFEADFHFFGLVRRIARRNHPLPHRLVRRVAGVFQFAAFVAEVPDIAVATIDVLFALLDRDVVLLRIGNGVFAGIDGPFAPGSDDLDVRSDGLIGQLKTYLIVPFSRATMGKAVGTELQCKLGLSLSDNRPRHGCAQ